VIVFKNSSIKLCTFDWVNFLLSLIALLFAALSAPKSPVREWLSEIKGIHFASDNHEFWNSMTFTLSSSALLTIVLFYLLSRYPNLKAQAASRRSLKRSFKQFKLACIDIFIVVSGYPQDSNHDDLLDVNNFRVAFKTDKTPQHHYWYDVVNGLNEYYLKLINCHLEEFREEIKRQSDRVDIYSDSDRVSLENLARHLRIIQSTSDDYDSVKSLCASLWCIFTSWHFMQGYSGDDDLRNLIESL